MRGVQYSAYGTRYDGYPVYPVPQKEKRVKNVKPACERIEEDWIRNFRVGRIPRYKGLRAKIMEVVPVASFCLKVKAQILGSRGVPVGRPSVVTVDTAVPETRGLWDFNEDQ